MAEAEKLVKRSQKVAFMDTEGTGTSYTRMTKFTEMSKSKNPVEYNRQYVDEESETNDIIGYSEEISYNFDQYTNNTVHKKIADITDLEKTGDDAVVDIVIVDLSGQTPYTAYKRKYAVVPDANDGEEAYTYSGSFKARGPLEVGTATVTEDGKTATYTAPSKG